MNKKLLFMAVAGAFALPSASQAAIDDAGMKYVSAAEGLSGSIRIRFLEDTEDNNVDPAVNFDKSRIIYRGSNDLGGGMEATYYFEMRPKPVLERAEGTRSVAGSSAGASEHNNVSGEDQIQIKFIDAGLKGPFGHVRVGEIETVTEALIPNADRGNDAGTSGALLVEDYERGIRWVSPNINGLMLGVSAEMIDNSAAEDDTVDAWDLVATYDLPMGLGLGGSYAVVSATEDDDEDEEGFRLGAEYEQDNWGVAYNYHSYKASAPGLSDDAEIIGHKDSEYNEHVIGANVKVNKFNFAFTFATAELANDTLDTDLTTDGVQGVSAERKTTTVDVGYTLGSKSKVIAAYETDGSRIGRSQR